MKRVFPNTNLSVLTPGIWVGNNHIVTDGEDYWLAWDDDKEPNGEEPAKPSPSQAKTAKRGDRPNHGEKAPGRITWPWRATPVALFADAGLSLNATMIGFAIIHLANDGPWNRDLHLDITYEELGKRAKVGSYKTAQRAVVELVQAGYVVVTSRGHAGIRLSYGPKIRNPGGTAE
jgi:hypothetical protein